MEKNDIAGVLDEIATFMELTGENPFKIRAYSAGARILENMTEDLGELIDSGKLADIPGLGEALVDKITTLRRDGVLPFHQKLKASIPAGLLEVMQIPGLGPKKVRALWTQLSVEDLAKLKEVCESGAVAELKGFGEKTQEKILEGIKNRIAYGKRHRWYEAAAIAEPILAGLRALPQVSLAESAGSLRRARETVGDLDFLVASSEPKPIMDWFVAYPGVKEVTAHGETKSSVRFENGLQADLRVVPAEQFYFALHHFTGSKEHNVAMRHRALGRGLSMSEWGFKSVDEKSVAPGATSEEEVFRALGLPWIPPELREGNGEIDAAEAGKLPKLVQLSDLRGVFHNHTTESDGDHTLDQMAAAAEAHGWEYLGISDHSKSSFQAGGLDEARLEKQLEDIAKLNASKKYRVRVLSGSEVDILKDGTLDFSDDVLARLDFVVASVHNLFTLDREAQTARIIKAIENEHVDMVGHLTGRLLNKREPYDVDIAKVIDAAAANDTIIELNANPWRLDLDWRWWRRAAEKGVLCSINPDAHDVDQLGFAAHGVRIARKGWLTPEQVLNTRSLPEVLSWLGR
ncbi:MAG: DNA polymerase/3'-5' exonuclease PolX [Verrucomicrobia bacterium]|nr:DNA polymerase/3'-5' exonuclease PolX [Verrucomicrobiota bacterium]